MEGAKGKVMNEERIEAYLEQLDLNPHDRSNYWLIRCPRHEDRQPSAQCFKDGWIQCHAGCGRFHINEVCRERGDSPVMPNNNSHQTHGEAQQNAYKPKKAEPIVRGDFTALWLDLEPLDANIEIKGVPASELNKRGWRKYDGGNGVGAGVFIPYFDASGKYVPFYQVRHLEGERRFTFAPGITPICYGLEQLAKCKDYLCFTEGSRDSVILGMVGVPAIALPSASSDKLLEGLCDYCAKHSLMLVCIGDRDEAGDKLIQKLKCGALDYRTPVGKDVGEFYEEKGLEAVREHYSLFIPK